MSYQIEVRQTQPRHMAAVEFRSGAAEMGQHLGEAFQAVMAYLGRTGAQPSGPAVARYSPPDNGEFDVAAGFYVAAPIEGDGNVVSVELPASETVSTTHTGPYADLPQAYEAIFAWMQENGREPSEIMWEEYFSPPEAPPSETQTQVYWPVKSG